MMIATYTMSIATYFAEQRPPAKEVALGRNGLREVLVLKGSAAERKFSQSVCPVRQRSQLTATTDSFMAAVKLLSLASEPSLAFSPRCNNL